MPKPNESQIKEALLAAKHLASSRESRAISAQPSVLLAEQPRLRGYRRASEAVFTEAVSQLRFDTERFERTHRQSQIEWERLHEGQRAEAIQHSGAMSQRLSYEMQSRLKGIEVLQAAKVKPVVDLIDKPFLIWATPSNMLTDSQIEPLKSRAKFTFGSSADFGTREVNFYFLWSNPSDRFAVININAFLLLNGFCRAGQGGGFFPGDRRTNLRLSTILVPLEWWNQPPTSPMNQPAQFQQALALSASGGGGWGDVGAIESESINRGFIMEYTLFLVPPHGVTVIEVTLLASFNSGEDGDHSVLVDFDSGDFKVVSPVVLIAILT